MMRALIVALVLVFAVVYAAPAEKNFSEKFRALKEQLSALEAQMAPAPVDAQVEEAKSIIFSQPQKKMVAWQPMKKSVDERASLVHAVETRLSEVLRAGERLGVSAEEVLQDLRYRNSLQ